MAENEKKIATYICTGCGIGEALEIDELSSLATGECKTALCKTHEALCSDEGLELIRKDIADEGVNAALIAACSPRVKQHEFSFGDEVFVERANLREGVAWILEGQDEEDINWLAKDYLRMSAERLRRTKHPEPFSEGEFYEDILVVGGGVAGMTAALEAARAGAKVSLLEKTGALGGHGARWAKSIPSLPPYRELEDTGVQPLIDEVNKNPNVDVFLDAEITSTEGGPCKFEVQLTSGSKEVKLKIGAIVLATGFTPYDPAKLGHLGYGQFEDVVTNVDFETMVAAGELKRPSDGGAVKNVLFLQCAGSRDADHLAYCSTVCCNTTLKQATQLKQADPDAQAYVLYKDMRTPGQGEEFYRQVQRDGAVFIRGELKEISKPNGKLSVAAQDLLLDDAVSIEDLDLVVLATGMEPTTKMEGETVAPLEGDAVDEPRILKLNYHQGPEMPNLKYGYPDSHFICFPYETRRTGIYAAGAVRRAMDMAAARRDATGAALKALQCVALTQKGQAVHPRALDQGYPEFFMQRCTQCKRCTEECPFGAINEDEKANPLPNITRCRRCGTCLGACPERIISFKTFAVDMINAMIKEIEVPDEFEEKPAILAFCCENDAQPVLEELARKRIKGNPYIRWIPLRCMGSVNLIWVSDALSKGMDGVLFFGCKHGDDYQCHFVKGSELCNTRLSKIQETLDRLMLESERVRFEQISMTDGQRVTEVIEEFMEQIDTVGPNPYKGM
jgi:quinone-modifying oxidoreductase subunit QmoB